MAKPKTNRIQKSLVQMGISAVVLTVLFLFVDIPRARSVLSQAVPGFLVPAFLVCILDRMLMAYKFRLILNTSGTDISTWNLFRIYYICSYQGLIVPFGVGPDILRFLRFRRYGASSENLLASILMERFLGMIATLSLVVVSLCLLALRLSGLQTARLVVALLLAVTGCLALVLWLLFDERLRNAALEKLKIRSVFSRIRLEAYYDAFARFKGCRLIFVRFLWLSLLEQLFPVLVIYLCAHALMLSIHFMDCLAVIPISTFAERLPLSFDGLGIREGTNIFLFGLMQIDYSTSLILSLVAYLVFLISLAPAAVWSFFESDEPAPENR